MAQPSIMPQIKPKIKRKENCDTIIDIKLFKSCHQQKTEEAYYVSTLQSINKI